MQECQKTMINPIMLRGAGEGYNRKERVSDSLWPTGVGGLNVYGNEIKTNKIFYIEFLHNFIMTDIDIILGWTLAGHLSALISYDSMKLCAHFCKFGTSLIGSKLNTAFSKPFKLYYLLFKSVLTNKTIEQTNKKSNQWP